MCCPSSIQTHSSLRATVDLPAGGLHSVAVNPATGKVYVANAGEGSVSVIEGGTKEIAKSIDVAAHSQFFGVASIFVDPSNNRVYVSRVDEPYQDWGLSVLDGETDSEIAEVKLDGAAGRMSLDPSGKDLYVIIEYSVQLLSLCPNYRILVVIDTEANSVSECLDFGSYPIVAGVSPDGSTLYYFWVIESQTTLTIVDLPSHRALTTIERDFTPKDVIVHPASGRLYIMTDNSGDCCTLGTNGHLLAMDPNGKSIAWTVGLGFGPVDLASDLDAGRFYVVTADRSLHIIEDVTYSG